MKKLLVLFHDQREQKPGVMAAWQAWFAEVGDRFAAPSVLVLHQVRPAVAFLPSAPLPGARHGVRCAGTRLTLDPARRSCQPPLSRADGGIRVNSARVRGAWRLGGSAVRRTRSERMLEFPALLGRGRIAV